jgi:type II secretory pathway component PulF
MAVVVGGGLQALPVLGVGARGSDIAAVVILVPVGIGAYALALWLLRIEGREDLEAILVRVPVLRGFLKSKF